MSHSTPSIEQYPAIILAGGLGTRLRSVVQDLPKPMAAINGKPFLHYLFLFFMNFVVLLNNFNKLLHLLLLINHHSFGLNVEHTLNFLFLLDLVDIDRRSV